MAVALRITSEGRIEVDAFLSSERHHIRGAITFILDTGSRKSILGARDAEALGFPTGRFAPYVGRPLMGIGGRIKPFDVGPCRIVLGDAEIVADERLLYLKPRPEVRSSTSRKIPPPGVAGRVFATPSLLGTDVLSKSGCILHVDWPQGNGEVRRS